MNLKSEIIIKFGDYIFILKNDTQYVIIFISTMYIYAREIPGNKFL